MKATAKEVMQALIEARLAVRKADVEDDAKKEELRTLEREFQSVMAEGSPAALILIQKVFEVRKEAVAAEKALDKQQRLYKVRATTFLAALKKEKLVVIAQDECKRFYCDGWIAVVSFPSYNKTLMVADMYQVEVL